MRKRIYISADYSENQGDRDVVEELNKIGRDDYHVLEFKDMSEVVKGSVSKDSDCRACDLKKEFNNQINASSVVVFVVGDKTKNRTAGSECSKAKPNQFIHICTPYKQNTNGTKYCKKGYGLSYKYTSDIDEINGYSYLRHEFEQAKQKNKKIVILYNSTRCETNWLPSYMSEYQNCGIPFWKNNSNGIKVVNYNLIKEVLGYE